MANEIITKSGKRPDQSALPFTITTNEVQAYLQKKLDVVVASMVANGSTNINHVNLVVYTTKAGTKFFPFVVVLPLSVLEQKAKENGNSNELPMFRPENQQTSARVMEPIFKMFGSYAYDPSDADAFRSVSWRRDYGVSKDGGDYLRFIRMPRIVSYDNGRQKAVSFIIDPVRVFYDMLRIEGDPNNNYRIDDIKVKELKTGEYQYFVKRTTNFNKKKKKYHNTFIVELDHKMRGSR